MNQNTVDFDFTQANALFAELTARLSDMTPVMDQIGDSLTESTKQRFSQGIAPDGTPWAANSAATLARKKGTQPLIGETKNLMSTIFHESNASGVSWGSNVIYAAVQQFGAGQGAFGAMSNGGPIPFGTIPARPFIGVSPDDQNAIITTLEFFLEVD